MFSQVTQSNNVDHLSRGDKALADGYKPEAIWNYRKAAEILSKEEKKIAILKLANVYYQTDKISDAFEVYLNLLTKHYEYLTNQERKKVQLGLGQCYARLKNYEGAIKSYEQALEIGNDDPSDKENTIIHFYLGEVYYKLVKKSLPDTSKNQFINLAIEHFRLTIPGLEDQGELDKLTKANFCCGDIHFFNSEESIKLVNYQTAIQFFEKSVSLNKQLQEPALTKQAEALAHFAMGEAYASLAVLSGNYKSAISSYTAAIECGYDEVFSYSHRARALSNDVSQIENTISDYTKALKACQIKIQEAKNPDEIKKLEKKLTRIYIERGNSYINAGDHKSALIDFIKAVLHHGKVKNLAYTMISLQNSMGKESFTQFFLETLSKEFTLAKQSYLLGYCFNTRSSFIKSDKELANFFANNDSLLRSIKEAFVEAEQKLTLIAMIKMTVGHPINHDRLNSFSELQEETFSKFLMPILSKEFYMDDQEKFLEHCLQVLSSKKTPRGINQELKKVLSNNQLLLEKIKLRYAELKFEVKLVSHIKGIYSIPLFVSLYEDIIRDLGSEVATKFFFHTLMKNVSHEDIKVFFDVCLKTMSSKEKIHSELKELKEFFSGNGKSLFEKIKVCAEKNYPELQRNNIIDDKIELKRGESGYRHGLFYAKPAKLVHPQTSKQDAELVEAGKDNDIDNDNEPDFDDIEVKSLSEQRSLIKLGK